MNPIYKQYVALRLKREVLEKQESELKEQIVAEMLKNKEEKTVNIFGTFTVACRTSYAYTEAVKKIEEQLKLAKYKEEKSGKAEAKETKYLRYTEPKDEKETT